MTYFILWGPNATLLQKRHKGSISPSGRDAMRFDDAEKAQKYIDESDRFEDWERELCSVLGLVQLAKRKGVGEPMKVSVKREVPDGENPHEGAE